MALLPVKRLARFGNIFARVVAPSGSGAAEIYI
jgi:hypothetical protein